MLADRVKTWTQVWRKEGYDEGHEEGLDEGRETQIRTLRRLLLRRFGALPEWAETRLTHATSAQLEMWTDYILDARTLEDVFDPGS